MDLQGQPSQSPRVAAVNKVYLSLPASLSQGDCSKLQPGKFQLSTRKNPFHKEGAQIVEQVVEKCCKIHVFKDIEKFWTRP